MLNKIRPLYLFACFCLLISISACKKKKEDPVAFIIDKSITLNEDNTSAIDTLFVTRDDVSINLKVYANTRMIGKKMKRLYVFTRTIDDINAPGAYKSIGVNGFITDKNNQLYHPINPELSDSVTNTITFSLRTNSPALIDEYYYVYTEDVDYTGPSSTEGVVIGPARFFIIYGKLTEYTGKRIYNSFSGAQYHYPAFCANDVTYLTAADPVAKMDIYENTDNSPLFLGKFKSMNGTSFVKATNDFSYATATDISIVREFNLGVPFTETPDSIQVGDVYLMNILGTSQVYAAMKIMYVGTENGKTGAGNDAEFFIFNLKR